MKQDRLFKYNVTSKRVRVSIAAAGGGKYFIFWVWVCALGIQYSLRMRHIVICGLSGYSMVSHITS